MFCVPNWAYMHRHALSDGGLVVVLVPDSQGGTGGLTNEYIKTLVVK